MSKVRVIAVTNQKGGVGKTTTAINLSACLAAEGKRVLAVDADQQGNTTSGLGLDKNDVPLTISRLRGTPARPAVARPDIAFARRRCGIPRRRDCEGSLPPDGGQRHRYRL